MTVAGQLTWAPVTAPSFSIGQTTEPTIGGKTLVTGGLILGTGVSGLISYFGIRAGIKGKGPVKIISWVIGIPAALAALVGTAFLAHIAISGLPERLTGKNSSRI